jgi:hypothetical protein
MASRNVTIDRIVVVAELTSIACSSRYVIRQPNRNIPNMPYCLRLCFRLRAVALALRVGLAFASLISYWLRPVGLAFAPLILGVVRLPESSEA